MDEQRHLPLARELKDLENLRTRRAWRVGDTQTETETTFIEAPLHELLQSGALFFGRVLVLEIREGHEVGAVRAERRPATQIGVVEQLDPSAQMANRGTVMDDRIAFARRDPIGDRVHAELELGGDAVQRLETVTHRVLSMCVQIDEPGREDQAARVDDLGCLERSLRDGDDRTAGDTDVAYRRRAPTPDP